jgi:hypothetical protein
MNDGENHCLNGLWDKDSLQRMYDQTAGFAMALIHIYGYPEDFHNNKVHISDHSSHFYAHS